MPIPKKAPGLAHGRWGEASPAEDGTDWSPYELVHDLNNHLEVVLAHTELLLARLSHTDPAQESLLKIQQAAAQCAGRIRDLLAAARQPSQGPLNLNAIIKDMAPTFSNLLGEGIQFATALDPALASVAAEAGQIEQILVNLVRNARDAMPRGGRVTLETGNVTVEKSTTRPEPGLPSGQYVKLVVTDTGAGIKKEMQPHIFKPFFTSKPAGQGMGLGLTIVGHLVKQVGGSIQIESQPGEGTRFEILLPCTKARRAKPTLAPGRVAREAPAAPPDTITAARKVPRKVNVRSWSRGSPPPTKLPRCVLPL